jgi:hypothetical protein
LFAYYHYLLGLVAMRLAALGLGWLENEFCRDD